MRDEQGALIEDEEAAVEEFADLDTTAGIGAPVRSGRELRPASGDRGPTARG